MVWLLLFPACGHVNRNTPAGTQTVMLRPLRGNYEYSVCWVFPWRQTRGKNIRIITVWQLSLPQFHIVLFSTLLQWIYWSAVHPLISFNLASGLGTWGNLI